ncbi:AMP-dependent synthetase/ligase [Raineya orbicola]|uniref:Long-chain acyl-CoA synthetases (AMP-forming) n=1 Tax=Raineya orbicola TaxID=2016530 RepID=A0A2N3IDH9_9BACT|nr:long-chain fatty acid--CoA ligase [Raineya orbicola]PKQ68338.1 Long-chain acyl-CoA synthetases (AMP-forming) [Raineya orbicola]
MQISRVFDLLEYQAQNFPKKDALACKEYGGWVHYSTQDFISITNQLATAFLELGIQKGDKIAIISNNRPEWNFVDFAIQKVGAVSVPMYPTITAEDYRYILEHSEAKLVFAGSGDIYEKLLKAIKESPFLTQENLYTFEQIPNAQHWRNLLKKANKERLKDLEQIKNSIQPQDLFTIIYTSGTTGKPKGVMLSHKNVVSNVKSAISSLVLTHEHKALSFLPLCHIFERTVTCAYIYKGISIYYAENLDTIGENLKEVQPHVFTAVPRILEKVYEKILAKAKTLSPIAQKLFFWALDLAEQYDTQENKGLFYNLQLSLANNLVFDKWREALGGYVKYVICGSAALNPKLARIFWGACIPILEGYGMTETSPVITAGSPNKEDYIIGTVGKVIEGVQVKIAEDGEILVKGDNVMMGYYKDSERTAETFTEDGWLKTGDIGEWVQGKYLKITDRKKEIFKTSGGKYIAPQPIENNLKLSLYIEQAMVIGENQKFPAALIVPFEEALKNWCLEQGLPYENLTQAIDLAEVQMLYQKEIDKVNEQLAQYEKIKKFVLLPTAWSIEGGELTPTLKLKRKNISQKYEAYINEIYAEQVAV